MNVRTKPILDDFTESTTVIKDYIDLTKIDEKNNVAGIESTTAKIVLYYAEACRIKNVKRYEFDTTEEFLQFYIKHQSTGAIFNVRKLECGNGGQEDG